MDLYDGAPVTLLNGHGEIERGYAHRRAYRRTVFYHRSPSASVYGGCVLEDRYEGIVWVVGHGDDVAAQLLLRSTQ